MNVLSVGELLWDVFPDSERLGGACFNFAAHLRRLGHRVAFLSAVGDDERGRAALERAAGLGLPREYIQVVPDLETGVVTVRVSRDGQPDFTIHRPAAYDGLRLDAATIARIHGEPPEWIYFGTLQQIYPQPRAQIRKLLEALPGARRFYDVNLRRDSYNRELVLDLMSAAQVVKLNDHEVAEVDSMAGTSHRGLEEFARDWAGRFGWQAAAITRGDQGSAVLLGDCYVEAPGYRVRVADTVGAGDAYAAAFLHGIGAGWDPAAVADFANRLGAVVASRPGGVPPWTLADCAALAAAS